jgi:hypothetical protein
MRLSMGRRNCALWLVEVAAVLLVAVVGCGGPAYDVAEVDGVVTINGRPGNKLQVMFVPDVDAGTNGPTSMAETDEQGRFKLEFRDSPTGPLQAGAVVGSHRVALTDLQLAASATGVGVPVRLRPEYAQVGSTPLVKQIAAGPQTIEIKFDGSGAAIP